MIELPVITPDIKELLAVIRREKQPGRVHHFELYLDEEIREAAAHRFGLLDGISDSDPYRKFKRDILVHRRLGYDTFRCAVTRKDIFDIPDLKAVDTAGAGQSRGERGWIEEHHGPIGSWEDFENYAWPEIKNIDFGIMDWMETNLPENMGVFDLTAHILELVVFLIGYETLCYKIYDEPELVDAVCEKIGDFYIEYTKQLCDYRTTCLVFGSDDMGFKTGPFFAPDFLRTKILPWHAKYAEIAHASGRPYLIHACGQLEEIMEDFIGTVKIDAKHSFEDTILPVGDAFRIYGDRISILGGLDVDFLCRSGEEAIRARVRATLDACMTGKGYCLGTGNSVANYIPLENYLTMIDEGMRYRLE